MRKAFLNKAKATLLEMKEQMIAEIRHDLKKGREGSKGDGMDTYDLASEERDREISLILTDRDRGKLRAIDDALERLEDGSYGECESCESEIAGGRLEAMPFTRLCVQCQADQETKARQNRKVEDDRAYRHLPTPGLDEDSQ